MTKKVIGILLVIVGLLFFSISVYSYFRIDNIGYERQKLAQSDSFKNNFGKENATKISNAIEKGRNEGKTNATILMLFGIGILIGGNVLYRNGVKNKKNI